MQAATRGTFIHGPVAQNSMKKWLRKHFDTCFIVAQVWVDGFVTLACCFLGFWIFREILNSTPGNQPIHLPPLRQYSQLMVLITGVTLCCFWGAGLYRWKKSILNVEEYRAAFKATLLSFLITNTLVFLLREPAKDSTDELQTEYLAEHNPIYRAIDQVHQYISLHPNVDFYSRVMFVIIFLLIFFATFMQRAISFLISSSLHERGLGNTNVAVFGTGPMAQRVQQKLRLFPTLGFNFVGFLDDDERRHGESIRGFRVLGGRQQLDELRQRYGIRRLLIAKPDLPEDDLVELCARCDNYSIQYQVVPRLYHFFSKRFTVDNLDSIPLITLADKVNQPLYRLAKGILDFMVATFVLTVAFVPMVIIAFLIKQGSKGPVLFSQIRVGQGGRTFRILKFRTMYVEMCGDDITPQSKDDPRITKIGRFLRATSLDELPQFINVLRGEMSMVGPRPEMPFIVAKYTPTENLRLDAKPGITGLWQISEARKAPIHENLDYDLYYIENQSIFLDIVILAMTFLSVFRVRGTS
ncbi:MAG: sugar transferase [Planctomycetota bacterium]|nr:MAG: sugar transferase [Planctomycetota bacterium]